MFKLDADLIKYIRLGISSALSLIIWGISAPILSELVRFIFEAVHGLFIGEAGLFAKVSYYISFMNWLQEKAYNYGGIVASGLTFYVMHKYGNALDKFLVKCALAFGIEVDLSLHPRADGHAPAPVAVPKQAMLQNAADMLNPTSALEEADSRPRGIQRPLPVVSPMVSPIFGLKASAASSPPSPEITPRQRAATVNGALNGMPPNGHHSSPRTEVRLSSESPRKDARALPFPAESPRGRAASSSMPLRSVPEGRGSPAPDNGRVKSNAATEATMIPAPSPAATDRFRTISNPVRLALSSNGQSPLSSPSSDRAVNALVDVPGTPLSPAKVLAANLTSPRPTRPASGSYTPMSAAAAPPFLERSGSGSAIVTRTTSDRLTRVSHPSSSAGSLVERGSSSNPLSPRPNGGGN